IAPHGERWIRKTRLNNWCKPRPNFVNWSSNSNSIERLSLDKNDPPSPGRLTPAPSLRPAGRNHVPFRTGTHLERDRSSVPVPAVAPRIQSAPLHPPKPSPPARFPVPLPHISSAQSLPAHRERS